MAKTTELRGTTAKQAVANRIEYFADWREKVARELRNSELETAQLRVLLGSIDDEIAGIKQWN